MSEATNCPSCQRVMVEINLNVDGNDVTMCSCSDCDTRVWRRGDEAITLDGVLHNISETDTRYKRSLSS